VDDVVTEVLGMAAGFLDAAREEAAAATPPHVCDSLKWDSGEEEEKRNRRV